MAARRPLLASVVALALVACSNNPSSSPGDDRTTATTAAESGSTESGSTGSGALDTATATADATTPSSGGVTGTIGAPTPSSSSTTASSTTTSTTTTSSTSTSTTTTVAATTTTVAGQPPVVDVAAYAVYDVRGRRFLAQSEADTRLPVGSLMKLLTAHVAYQAGDPTRVIPAPEGLLLSDDESHIGIRPGQELARDLLIRAMLKASANDAARMLAVDIAGSEAAYAERMNAAATALGLTDTRAVNVTGLDAEGQYSSADDLVRLGLVLMANPSFQIAVRDPIAELNGQAFPNPNDLIGTYPGADGIKTGRTSGAGWCVLASATRENRRIIVAVLGAPSEEARRDAATALLNWGFAQP